MGCRWELVFSVWLVKSALEMWKGKGEEACGCAQTHTAFPESQGSKHFHVLPRLWLNWAFPNAPRRCSMLNTSGVCNYRKETLKEDVPLKKWPQILLLFQPEYLWVLLHKSWMANNKLSHIPFSTGLLTVTGKEKKPTCVQRGNMNPREICDN